ncbi:helix-turn-helix transcriptional regulator [Mucilaginibacter sp.]|uniref:helix-turn-helix domain-containing protein n=1 Tax=Mucilaginibacter sp. TaxID=1882438 RepID=UPI002852AE70|nr:helix-turn-helix transcriptional regulator [Mucilaginibacter sp.]
MMVLYIRNMMCVRCKIIVELEFEKLGLHCASVELGKVETFEILSDSQLVEIKNALLNSGLELINNKKSILAERIKNTILSMVYNSECQVKINFSNYLSQELKHDYTYLANIFSDEKGLTIEQYFILTKIQRIKELISYNELNLTEISWKLNYSSVAHLSTQFKKVTGITPSLFRYFSNLNIHRPQMCEL